MKPAFSVIFLTVLIGAGQGLFIALIVSAPDPTIESLSFGAVGGLTTLGLLISGLLSSFFHLGRPERAWRAATMWRTSWLSREVIVLPLLMVCVTLYTALQWPIIDVSPAVLITVGAVGLVLVAVLFVCTGMIYACIKFLQEWASPWTLINFSLLGSASGFVLAAAIGATMGRTDSARLAMIAMALILTGLVCRLFMFYRNSRIKFRSNIQSAIGIKHKNITQRSMGMTGGSFNTRAFFNHASVTLLKNIKTIVVVCTFILPLVFIGTYLLMPLPQQVLWIAVALQFLGLVAERWLFFAEANHPQNLYYQTIS